MTVPAPDRRRWWQAEPWVYAASLAFTALGTTWALRLWRARLDVPFAYYGDAVATSAHVKAVLTTGWYESQPLLGAPAGQHFHDYPTSDDLHLVVIKVIGWFTSSWPVALNVYYLLGFVLAALAATWCLRGIGAGRVTTVVAATLYALAPYHFTRGEQHLWLASYYVIPPAVLLLVRVLRGEPLWTGGRRLVPRLPVTTRALGTTASLLLLGWASAYYSFFSLCLLAVAGIAALVQRRDVRRFLGAVAAGVLLAAAAVSTMVPDTLYERVHGADVGALARSHSDAETYSLKITSLVLPVPGHRIPLFATIRATYDSSYPVPSESPALGTVAAVGLVLLLVVAVIHLARPRAGGRADGPTWNRLVELAGLTVVALLFATLGGVSSLISFLDDAIRGWNRMSIVIALFCLAGVALALDAGLRRLDRRLGRAAARSVAAVTGLVILAGGVLDQVPDGVRPDHAAIAADFWEDDRWVTQLGEAVGEDAMIFQLPYQGFPETPADNGVFDADQLRPSLHSTTLRWSGGGVKGRASADWPALVAGLPAQQASAVLASADFSAVLLDRQALGDAADAVSADWRSVAGAPVVTGRDGRYEAYDLRQTRARLVQRLGQAVVDAAGDAATRPTMLYPAEGTPVGPTTWGGTTGAVDILVDNASSTPASVTLSVTEVAGGRLDVSTPGGEATVDPGASVPQRIEVPAGRSTITVRSVDGSPVTILAPTVTPERTPWQILGGT